VERQGRSTIILNWIVVEGISTDAVGLACEAPLADNIMVQQGYGSAFKRALYTLQLVVPKMHR
jgi:hypothetical protein